MIVAHGGRFGGYALHLVDGHVVFHYNAIPPRQYSVRTASSLQPGLHHLLMTFTADAAGGPGGSVAISVDGREDGRGRVEQTLNTWISHTEGFDIGQDSITPVDPAYRSSSETVFTGVLERAVINLL